MSYDSKKIEFGKEHLYIVEMDLDYCSLTSGVGPCTATEVGDAKCYNTFETTNDLPNYTKEVKTYTFCEDRSPHPIGLDAIPSLMSVNISPSKIDLSGGLGVRASVSLTFRDHPHSDIDIDKYVNERTYIASDRSTFWRKLRSRNPNYQFRNIRVLSGYLENGKFLPENFETRFYVIESMNVSGGMATIIAKDPLKLASMKKAQAPIASKGLLQSALNDSATSITLTPSGIGSEYEVSGFIAIKSEVMTFTRVSDVLTVVRGVKNTLAIEHDVNDTVQQCLEYSGGTRGQLDFIVKDLLTNFANIDPAFINDSAWDAEVSTFLSGLLDGIVTKPFDVFKLLIELAESMPHYLWWDEKTQKIELTALKAPPISSDVLDMESGIVDGSFRTVDKPDMRKSTIFVNFGMFDPTQKLDEPNNFQQTYIRADTDSISKYGSSQIKVINSRWISNTNKAAALQLAALIGRRFSDIPREITFSLEAKDSDVWIGQTKAINHLDIVDGGGLPIDTNFQIMSAKESDNFNYSALEFTYGEALPDDEGGGDPDVDLVIIGANQQNINLRTLYNGLFPAPDASTQAKFIIESGVIIGSSSTATISMDTGTWPAGAIITLQTDITSFVVGAGGDGGNPGSVNDGDNGGDAIILNFDLTLVNNGVIGSGGGGGAGATSTEPGETGLLAGGGGAGNNSGFGPSTAANGGTQGGGNGGVIIGVFGAGGDGGDLGDAGEIGQSSSNGTGGLPGIAIDKNGFVLTETVTGDIRGSIVA